MIFKFLSFNFNFFKTKNFLLFHYYALAKFMILCFLYFLFFKKLSNEFFVKIEKFKKF